MGCCVYVQQPIFEQKIYTNVVRNSLWQNWYQELLHFQQQVCLRNLYQQIPLPPVEHTELSHKLEEYAGVYENPAYGELKVELAKNGLYLHFKDWLLPMEHFHYDTFRVRGVKEDTIFITMPMTYHYEELTGKLDGFSLKLEPEVDPVWFAKRVAKE